MSAFSSRRHYFCLPGLKANLPFASEWYVIYISHGYLLNIPSEKCSWEQRQSVLLLIRQVEMWETHGELPSKAYFLESPETSGHATSLAHWIELEVVPCDLRDPVSQIGLPWCSVVKNSPVIQELQETWFDPWVRKMPWRRAWQPTLLFLLGEFHGQRSLVGHSPWGHKESDTTEATWHAHMHVPQIKYVSLLFYHYNFTPLTQTLGIQRSPLSNFKYLEVVPFSPSILY